jgi:hypothetical protein
VGRSLDLAPFAGRTVELALVAKLGALSTTLIDVDDLTVIAAATAKAAVTVTPALLEIKAGGVSAEPLAATVNGSGDPVVTWRVREPAGGTLDLGNRYHAPREPGIYHAVATSRADPYANAEVSIRVLPSIVFPTPSIQVVAGATVALHPVLAPGATPGFYLREPEGGTVASTGAMVGFRYTAPLVPGTYHLDAVDGSAPGNRATLTLVVIAPPTVEIEPAALNLAMGGSFLFQATIPGIEHQEVRWFLREPAFGTIDGDGIYVLPSGPAPPPEAIDEVYAESMAVSGARAMVRVTIQDGAAIQPASVALAPGKSFFFKCSPEGPEVWSVPGGTAHGTITKDGQYTAPSTPGAYRVQVVVGARPPAFATITVR